MGVQRCPPTSLPNIAFKETRPLQTPVHLCVLHTGHRTGLHLPTTGQSVCLKGETPSYCYYYYYYYYNYYYYCTCPPLVNPSARKVRHPTFSTRISGQWTGSSLTTY